MKFWWPLIGLASIGVAFLAPPAKGSQTWAVILGGDTDGYLSPCGCTSPMMGGIRRRATATRDLAFGDHTVILDNGGLVAGTARQDEMKAETMAQALAIMNASAVNFGPTEATLGPGIAQSLNHLSGERFASSSYAGPAVDFLQPRVTRGPFMIVGASDNPALSAKSIDASVTDLDQVVGDLIEAAQASQKAPILLLQGSHAKAVELAKRFPSLALIQYRFAGDAPGQAERVGNTVLATTGERGKSLVRLTWDGSRFTAYTAVKLDPSFADDPSVARIYRTYLDRVDSAGLLDKLPRRSTPAFAGSASCAPCHAAATKVWKDSAHSHALKTLEVNHEGRDPDCVPCHVTGLQSLAGFRSRATTPKLSFVGCESCHGPAAAHVSKPKLFRLPKTNEKTCISCHSTLNSPNFRFSVYWQRIKHK